MTEAAKETFPLAQPDRARPVPRPRRKRDTALAAIVLASLAIHASVLLPMLFTAKTAPSPSVETPVEVIQEPPPEPKKEPQKSGKDAAKEAQEKAKAEQAKAEAEKAKAEQAKAEQAKAEADKARAEQAKADQAKAEQAKAEQAKAEQEKEREKPKPPERKAAKAEPPKPQPQKTAPPPKPAESQAQVAERMRKLLGQPQSLDPTALPGESANGTEGATYEQLVMSRLTKAVSMDRHPGRPGFATVTFVLGEHGEVISVELNRPSGDPLLDSEATDVVRRGAPYPTPPSGAKRSFTVTLQSRPVL